MSNFLATYRNENDLIQYQFDRNYNNVYFSDKNNVNNVLPNFQIDRLVTSATSVVIKLRCFSDINAIRNAKTSQQITSAVTEEITIPNPGTHISSMTKAAKKTYWCDGETTVLNKVSGYLHQLYIYDQTGTGFLFKTDLFILSVDYVLIYQELFNSAVNFTTKNVPDTSGNGYDATLSGSNNIYLHTIQSVTFENYLVDTSGDFAIFARFQANHPQQGVMQYISRNSGGDNLGRLSLGLWYRTGIYLNINGVRVLSGSALTNTFEDGLPHILTLQVISNVYKIFVDGVYQNISYTNTETITLNQSSQTGSDGNNATINSDHFDFSVINDTVSNSEIATVGNNSTNLRALAVSKPTKSYYFGFSENGGSFQSDIIQGEKGAFLTGGAYVQNNDFLKNIRYGFDVYENNSVAGEYIYIALKYDDTSFGHTITGYTFVETVLQDGNSFLKCETILDNSVVAGIESWYSTDRAYADFAGAPTTVDYIETDSNKITLLQLT